MKKEEKMDPNSVKSLKEFRQKQIQTNIKLHIIFLIMVGIVNICLVYFIIMYKNKISEITLKSNQRTSIIKQNTQEIEINQNTIFHKLVNIFAISINTYGNIHFSMLFETSDEVQMVKNFITSYTKSENPIMFFVYQGTNDSDDARICLNLISYYQNILMIIGTTNGYRFGYYFGKSILPNKLGYFHSDKNNCFIFSFQTNEYYECLNQGDMLEVNKNSLFNIGNGDIIINYNFRMQGGIVNFPFKSFNIPNQKNNVFTKENGVFDILEIEIYTIF